jgi:hypothetical protein
VARPLQGIARLAGAVTGAVAFGATPLARGSRKVTKRRESFTILDVGSYMRRA